MSVRTRSVPGQRLFQRVFARLEGQHGASSSFYDRFGLDDPYRPGIRAPWFNFEYIYLTLPPEDEDEMEEETAIQLVQRVARRAQRPRRRTAKRSVRSRIMQRAQEAQKPRKSVGESLYVAKRGAAKATPSHFRWAAEQMVYAEPTVAEPTTEPTVEEGVPVRRWATEPTVRRAERRTSRRERRQADQARDTSPAYARPIAVAQAARPLDRLLGSSPVRGNTHESRVLQQVASTARPSVARRLARAAQRVDQSSPVSRSAGVRRALKALPPAQRRAAAARIQTSTEHGASPTSVIASRMDGFGRADKGLRPALSSSPSLIQLAFERPEAREPVQDAYEPAPTDQAAPRAARQRVTRAAKEARTQRAAVRAGPTPVSATSQPNVRPAQPRTMQVAKRAQATLDATPTLRRGLQATRSMQPARGPVARIVRRIEMLRAAEGKSLAPAVTPHIAGPVAASRAVRRAVRVVGPQSLNRPIGPYSTANPVLSAARTRRAAVPARYSVEASSPTLRASRRMSAGSTSIRSRRALTASPVSYVYAEPQAELPQETTEAAVSSQTPSVRQTRTAATRTAATRTAATRTAATRTAATRTAATRTAATPRAVKGAVQATSQALQTGLADVPTIVDVPTSRAFARVDAPPATRLFHSPTSYIAQQSSFAGRQTPRQAIPAAVVSSRESRSFAPSQMGLRSELASSGVRISTRLLAESRQAAVSSPSERIVSRAESSLRLSSRGLARATPSVSAHVASAHGRSPGRRAGPSRMQRVALPEFKHLAVPDGAIATESVVSNETAQTGPGVPSRGRVPAKASRVAARQASSSDVVQTAPAARLTLPATRAALRGAPRQQVLAPTPTAHVVEPSVEGGVVSRSAAGRPQTVRLSRSLRPSRGLVAPARRGVLARASVSPQPAIKAGEGPARRAGVQRSLSGATTRAARRGMALRSLGSSPSLWRDAAPMVHIDARELPSAEQTLAGEVPEGTPSAFAPTAGGLRARRPASVRVHVPTERGVLGRVERRADATSPVESDAPSAHQRVLGRTDDPAVRRMDGSAPSRLARAAPSGTLVEPVAEVRSDATVAEEPVERAARRADTRKASSPAVGQGQRSFARSTASEATPAATDRATSGPGRPSPASSVSTAATSVGRVDRRRRVRVPGGSLRHAAQRSERMVGADAAGRPALRTRPGSNSAIRTGIRRSRALPAAFAYLAPEELPVSDQEAQPSTTQLPTTQRDTTQRRVGVPGQSRSSVSPVVRAASRGKAVVQVDGRGVGISAASPVGYLRAGAEDLVSGAPVVVGPPRGVSERAFERGETEGQRLAATERGRVATARLARSTPGQTVLEPTLERSEQVVGGVGDDAQVVRARVLTRVSKVRPGATHRAADRGHTGSPGQSLSRFPMAHARFGWVGERLSRVQGSEVLGSTTERRLVARRDDARTGTSRRGHTMPVGAMTALDTASSPDVSTVDGAAPAFAEGLPAATGRSRLARGTSGMMQRVAGDYRPTYGSRRRPFSASGVVARAAVPANADRFTGLAGRGERARTGGPRRRAAVSPGSMNVLESGSPSVEHMDDLPEWAARDTAAHRSGGRRQTVAERASLREDHAIVNALARAQDPEELARLVNRRGLTKDKLSEVLPSPAVKLVERVVHLETIVRQQVRREELAARSEGRRGMSRSRDFIREAQVGGGARQILPGATNHASGGTGGARVTQLANKLLNLIHLAEVDQRARDAQSQVRMSDSGVGDVSSSPASGSDMKAPNLNALKRDVFEAVVGRLQELDDRSVEDPDGHAMWW